MTHPTAGPPQADAFCITVVRDEARPLGKRLRADGSKQATVALADGAARTVRCETAAQLADVIAEVSADTHAALVLAHFGVPPGEPFRLLSRERMREALKHERGRARSLAAGQGHRELTDAELDGVHELPDADGVITKAVCRTKANASSSAWLLIDRDVDAQTPAHFAQLTHDDFMLALEPLLPGISQTTRVVTLSSSARVSAVGEPPGSKAGHAFVRLLQPVDRAALKAAVRARALAGQLAWLVDKHSAADGSVVARDWRLLLDDSVLSVERLVFCGAPTVDAGSGLAVHPQQVRVVQGAQEALDASLCTPPPGEAVALATRAAGREVRVNGSGAAAAFRVAALQPHTLLQTAQGAQTLAQAAASLKPGARLRCQAPLRDSDSWAAFVALTERGEPFVYDSGTSTSYFMALPPVADVPAMLRAAAEREGARRAGQGAAPPPITAPPSPTVAHKPSRPPGLPAHLIDTMPRAMRVAHDWMLRTAHRPQKELAFAASLSLMASVLGTRVRTPSGLRTNLYVISTAVTGSGKEHGRVCVRKALAAAGLSALEGGEPASGQAVMSRMADMPNTLLQLDEFGLLLAGCKEPRSPRYGVIKALLELTGAAGSSLPGTMYADTKLRASRPIAFPCLNLHCTSTPSTLYEALTGGDMASGFLNRVLLLESDAPMSTTLTLQARPDLDVPPEELVAWMQAVTSGPPSHIGPGQGNLFGLNPSAPHVVRPHALAEAAFADASTWLEGAVAIARERGMADLWSRFGALAAQLALIHAAADHTGDTFASAREANALEIGPQAAQWAIAVAQHCMLRMEQLLVGNLSSTQHEALQKRILAQLAKAGRNVRGAYGRHAGHDMAQLLNDRALSAAPSRDRDDALRTLLAMGAVHFVPMRRLATGRTRSAYVLDEFAPPEAALLAGDAVPGAPELAYLPGAVAGEGERPAFNSNP